MNERNGNLLEGLISVRQFTSSDSFDLITAGFPFGCDALKRFSGENILQKINLAPRETRLVVDHILEKRAIGFLSLLAHTRFLYSIRYVFSDPNFRQMGVATRLISYALSLAKNRGAKKIFLTSDTDPQSAASRLYKKFGFRIISPHLILKANGSTSNFRFEKKSPSFNLHLCSKRDYDSIFSLYEKSSSKELMDFFEINSHNFFNGISQDFQHFFSKNVFVNDSEETLALVFNLPLVRTAIAELYSQSPLLFNDMIIALNKILIGRGIKHLTISLFNARASESLHLLRDRQFYPYQALYMGRPL